MGGEHPGPRALQVHRRHLSAQRSDPLPHGRNTGAIPPSRHVVAGRWPVGRQKPPRDVSGGGRRVERRREYLPHRGQPSGRTVECTRCPKLGPKDRWPAKATGQSRAPPLLSLTLAPKGRRTGEPMDFPRQPRQCGDRRSDGGVLQGEGDRPGGEQAAGPTLGGRHPGDHHEGRRTTIELLIF